MTISSEDKEILNQALDIIQRILEEDAPAEEKPKGRKPRGKTLCKNSGITLGDISTAFSQSLDLKMADPSFYYNAIMDWSASSAELRADWIATARTFARRDLQAGKLKLRLSAKTGTNLHVKQQGKPLPPVSKSAITREEYLRQKAEKAGKPAVDPLLTNKIGKP